MYINRIFELSMVLDTEEFDEFFMPVYERFWDESRDEYVDQSLEEKGLLVVYRNSQYKKKIRLIVDADRMDSGTKDPEKLVHKLDKRIASYFNTKYQLYDFTLCGMRASYDIDVGDRKNAQAYLRALQRIGKVKGFSPAEYERFDEEASFCLDGNSNGISFLIYDLARVIIPQLECRDISQKHLNELIQSAEGILRAEVRLTKPKAIRAYTTQQFDSSEQIVELSRNCERIFMGVFQRIIPFGDFYKKSKAVEIIREEVDNNVMKRKMLHLLALVPEKRSLLLAQKATRCRKNDEVMEAFAKINLSPVTLSKRFDEKHLKSLYTYLEN